MDKKLEMLARVPLFSALDKAGLAQVARLADEIDLPAGKQLTLRHTIEIEGQAKPACVAETVVLLLP